MSKGYLRAAQVCQHNSSPRNILLPRGAPSDFRRQCHGRNLRRAFVQNAPEMPQALPRLGVRHSRSRRASYAGMR
jgi:hypothetical protein